MWLHTASTVCIYIYMLIFGYHQRITRRAATATFLPGNKDLHHSTEKAIKRQLKAAPAFFHWFFQDVNFLKWFLQQFISISSFRVWVLAPSNRVDGFLWFLNHLPSMVWVQISIAILLIYVGKKKLIFPRVFLWVPTVACWWCIGWPKEWQGQGIHSAPHHPKASQVDQSSERLKILPSNISQYVLSFPHLLLMHLPKPWWSFLACQIYDESPKVWLAHARAKIQY